MGSSLSNVFSSGSYIKTKICNIVSKASSSSLNMESSSTNSSGMFSIENLLNNSPSTSSSEFKGFRALFPTNAPNPLHPILPNMRLNNTDPRSKIEPNFGPFSLPPMVHPVGSQNNQSEDEEVTTSNINSHGASSNFNSETLNQMSAVDQGNESGEEETNLSNEDRKKRPRT